MTDYVENIKIPYEGFDWSTPIKCFTENRTWSGGMTYDGTKFIALNFSGYISTSTDGLTWNTPVYYSTLGAHGWVQICYGGGKYVVIGETGYVSTSTDGTTWVSATQPSALTSHTWRGLTYDGTNFWAIGYYGYIAKSSDGVSWTSSQLSKLSDETVIDGTNGWCDIIYVDGMYLALGNTGFISTCSSDASSNIYWDKITKVPNLNLGGNDFWISLVHDGSKYVALSQLGAVSTSKDGFNWTTISSEDTGLHYGNDSESSYYVIWSMSAAGGTKICAMGSRSYVSSGGLESFGYNSVANIASSRVIELGLTIGGKNFDGQWGGTDSVYLANNITLAGGKYFPYSLSNYLPNDGYDYEVLFYGACTSVATSGKTCQIVLLSGNRSSGYGLRLNRCTARTAATVRAGGNCILPIFHNDKYVTAFTQDCDTNNTGVYIRACGYRRIGSNSEWTKLVRAIPKGSTYDGEYVSVTYDGSKFWALSLEGYLTSSADGLNWSEPYLDSTITSRTLMVFRSISYCNGVFIILGASQASGKGYIYKSSDGINWTELSSTLSINASSYCASTYDESTGDLLIIWAGKVFVMSSPYNSVTELTSFTPFDTISGVTKGSNKFVAVAGTTIYTSSDGSNWYYDSVFYSSSDISIVGDAKGIIYANNRFLIITSGGSIIEYDDSTSTCEILGNFIPIAGTDSLNSIAYGNSNFLVLTRWRNVSLLRDSIKNINNIPIGGTNFNGLPVIFTSDQSGLIVGGTDHNLLFDSKTLASGAADPFSVADYIPNDGYDYELCISVWSQTGSTSGHQTNLMVCQGRVLSRPVYAVTVGYRIARTGAGYGDFKAVWLPISKNDKWITFFNIGSHSFSYNCMLHGYRRIGTNV